jgi:hypothetical protein
LFAKIGLTALSPAPIYWMPGHNRVWVAASEQTGNKEAVAVAKARAIERADNLRAIVEDISAQGVTSVRGLAEELERRHLLTARGGKQWLPTSVVRL